MDKKDAINVLGLKASKKSHKFTIKDACATSAFVIGQHAAKDKKPIEINPFLKDELQRQFDNGWMTIMRPGENK